MSSGVIESLEKTVVVLKETIELRVPKSKYAQVWSPSLKPEIHDEGEQRIYRWNGSQLTPTPKKAVAASSEPALPQIQWTTFKSWAAVGDWYRGLSISRSVPNGAVKARADEVVAGLKTEDEKLRAIYKYVAFQIRYVGVAFGLGRYQPHVAGEILLTGYGDCKDKHTLLQAMLNAEGILAEPALIGAGIKLNEEVPSPGSFNHLITVLPQNGKLVWLDTTSEVAPFGMLVSTIRGVKALVVPATGEATLAETPAQPPFENIDRFEAEATLTDKGELTSHNKTTMRGDTEIVMRSVLRQIAPVQLDQMAQYFSSGMGFGGTVSNAKASPVEQTDTPLTLEYDYKRDPYGDWPNRKIIPLLGAYNLPVVDEKNPPKDPIELGGPKTEIVTSRIHLPSGAGAKLPANVHAQSEYATLDKTYVFSNGVITVERTTKVLVKQVPAEDWKKYQAFYKEAGDGDEPWIVLTGLGGDTSLADASPEAEPLMNEARNAAQSANWPKVRETLDRVEKINPKEPFLYSIRGYAAMREMKLEEAERDFRHELELHPKEEGVYSMLASILQMRDHRVEAEKLLRDAMKELPTVRSFPFQLKTLLEKDGKLEDAATILREAVKNQPEDLSLKAEFGDMLFRTGKKDEALQVMQPLLEAKESDPVNTAAYALANAGLELNSAEQSERRVIADLEAKLLATGNNRSTEGVRLSYQLTSYWDTLGWILVKQGKLDAAEPYLRCAWNNGYSQEIGLHYATLLEKQGKFDEAYLIYASSPFATKPNGPDVSEQIKDGLARVTGKAKKKTVPTFQNLRTFKLPGKEPTRSYVTLQLLIGPRGMEDLTSLDDSDKLKAMSQTSSNLI